MQYLTTQQVADALGVTPRRVLQLAEARGIHGHRIGAAWLWPPSTPRRLKPTRAGRPRK